MSAHDDDLTTDLNRELRGRSDAMHGSTLDFGDVQRRARSIRRRRTATAVVGAAAAVALIVPTAALATHSGHRDEPGPATQLPSPTQTTTTTADGHQPAPGVMDVSDLPTGAPPQMDYVYKGVLHLSGGGTAVVHTHYIPNRFVEMADGTTVWLTSDHGTPYVEIEDVDGNVHDPVPSTFDLSVNAMHSIVAWMTPAGQVMIWEGWASQPRPLGDPVPGTEWRLGPVTGVGAAVPGKAGPDCHDSVCTVIVNVPGATWQPWEVSESGTHKLLDGSYLSVADENESGLTIGYTKITDSGNCSKLLGGGEFQGFATCKHTLENFSPDGRLILGLPAYPDGAGPNQIAMYDLEGQLLFDRGSTLKVQPTFNQYEWEDDTHVLITVYQEGQWSLVRVASDGSMEYAVAPRPGVDVTVNPYVIPTGGAVPAA
jgi:hypothetical protein